MSLFALTLAHGATSRIALLVEILFWIYVPVSFIYVSGYVTKKSREGTLLHSRRAPLAFAIPPAGQKLLSLNLFVLLMMPSIHYQAAIEANPTAHRLPAATMVPSIFYLVIVLAGLLILWVRGKRTRRQHALMLQAAGWLFILNVLFLLFIQSPYFMILTVAGQAFLLLEGGRTAREQFGLERLALSKLAKWSILICGAVILVEVPLTEIINEAMTLLKVPHPQQESVETFSHLRKASDILAFLLQAVVISPMIEELFFRGFLFTFLKNYTSTWLALILSAGVFAFAHVNLGSVISLWFLGVVLGIAYQHTGSLLLPICIHGCFNLMTALSLLLDKGTG